MYKKEKFKTFLLIFILSGLYIFIFSESGILERIELSKKYNILFEKNDYIRKENLKLSKECEKYRSGLYGNRDIIGSGFVYKTGNIIYINDDRKETISNIEKNNTDFLISIEHLRIIWILISGMILFYYFLKINMSDDLTDGPDFN